MDKTSNSVQFAILESNHLFHFAEQSDDLISCLVVYLNPDTTGVGPNETNSVWGVGLTEAHSPDRVGITQTHVESKPYTIAGIGSEIDPPLGHPGTNCLWLVVFGCLLGGSISDPPPNNGEVIESNTYALVNVFY